MQGVLCRDIDIKKIIGEYLQWGDVVISSYVKKDPKLISEIRRLFPDVIIIDNNLEWYEKELLETGKYQTSAIDSHMNHTFYQLKTTLAGIQRIRTDFMIKTRVDHEYSNMEAFVREGLANPNQILSSSIFVRGLTGSYATRYHMSDCLFMGRTDLIGMAMKLALLYYEPMNAESMIWRPYVYHMLQNRGYNVHDLVHLPKEEYLDIMCELFRIFPGQRLEPYRLKCSWGIVTERLDHHPDKTTREYLERGVE